jgi:hypothetical protein
MSHTRLVDEVLVVKDDDVQLLLCLRFRLDDFSECLDVGEVHGNSLRGT